MDLYITNKIKTLSNITISRIAAGEVVERPASVIKELIENSIDANATEIVIKIDAGGKNLISISDNGSGMDAEDLEISVARHTTSKLADDDLLNIQYFGFRGEALSAIGSISRMTIQSCTARSTEAFSIKVIGGEIKQLKPTAHSIGTTVEVCDLFFATPARLKFLRSEKTEIQNISDTVKRLALANTNISLKLISDNKPLLSFACEAIHARIAKIVGKDFISNSIKINTSKDGATLSGFVSLPTHNVGTSQEQYLYVNKRPVKDKFLLSAVRIAYQDFLSRDRYPVVVLFLDLSSDLVDVNVHPSKTEVRFRDLNLIRDLVIGGIKHAIFEHGSKTSSSIAQNFLSTIVQREAPKFQSNFTAPRNPVLQDLVYNSSAPVSKKLEESTHEVRYEQEFRLGAAKCQLHSTYIVSQTVEGLVLTDQHAAHERIFYETLKKQFDADSLARQRLLVPEIINLSENVMEKMLAMKPNFLRLGLNIDYCTNSSIIVTETPHLLGNCDIQKLVLDIIDDLREHDYQFSFSELVSHVMRTYACHYSIRAGKQLTTDEMNTLLRQIETTQHSAQCNHGRPTYIELKLKDIERLFERC